MLGDAQAESWSPELILLPPATDQHFCVITVTGKKESRRFLLLSHYWVTQQHFPSLHGLLHLG